MEEPHAVKSPPPGELKRIKARGIRSNILKKQNLKGFQKRYAEAMLNVELNPYFGGTVTFVIVCAGVFAGVQTYPGMDEGAAADFFAAADWLILFAFISEFIVKVSAYGNRPHKYLFDPWNRFDFIILFLCLPGIDSMMPFEPSLLRTIRLLRVLKLLNALPRLQILVGSLIKSTNSMVYILLLLTLLFYLYGVMGCVLFAKNDPFHFGDLQTSLLSLYRISTFEDWTDIMYINVYGCDRCGYPISQWGGEGLRVDGTRLPSYMRCDEGQAESFGVVSAMFFCSFVLFCTLIVFNLFIGVIITNIDKAEQAMMDELMEAFETWHMEKYHRPPDPKPEPPKIEESPAILTALNDSLDQALSMINEKSCQAARRTWSVWDSSHRILGLKRQSGFLSHVRQT